jgi:protocatechuate 3,4-dioxygenase beta subunit
MKTIAIVFSLTAGLIGCAAAPTPTQEPIIGGPCEGCEYVFSGMPERLGSSARIAPVGEPGQPMVIEGTVRNAQGKSIAGVIVYAYHTDSGGIYPRASTRHGRLRGWARTDDKGNYRFDTIRPGAYPDRQNPEHVHMHVIEPGKGTYWIDDIHFHDDPLLTPELERRQSGRGGDGLVSPERDKQGVWHVRRDIVLGRNIPGY